MTIRNAIAKGFKSLRRRPNSPLLQTSGTLATTSFSVARAAGLSDEQLALDVNLVAVRGIASVAAEFKKPLTVDIQDAYGSDLETAINALIDLDVAGINLEHCELATGDLSDIDEASSRIERVLNVARRRDFVVNAGCDALAKGRDLDEVLSHGKRCLAAGAISVLVWGAQRGVPKDEVERLTIPAGLGVKQLAEIGVARISIGPSLVFASVKTLHDEAKKLLG
ncbi:Phosphoenolpyruvate/pyruvate domain-containing protein [Ustulina deusta]|nr:Phosphoenolpyruvate/pyruvate domain-containing protein [Ustulina deusta]